MTCLCFYQELYSCMQKTMLLHKAIESIIVVKYVEIGFRFIKIIKMTELTKEQIGISALTNSLEIFATLLQEISLYFVKSQIIGTLSLNLTGPTWCTSRSFPFSLQTL